MDDAVAVVVAGEVVKRGGQRAARLVEGRVADGVHLDLQARAVRGAAEVDDLLVRVVEHAGVVRALVGGEQRSVRGAKAAVERAREAPSDARQAATRGHAHVHGLGKHADLEPTLGASREPGLERYVEVAGKPDAGDVVNHADATAREVVHGVLDVAHELGDRERPGDEV